MDDKQRLQLQNMINANNIEDQTDFIRNLKHSQIIRNEVNTMIMIKGKFRGDDAKIQEECVNECNFLFTYYTDIYNKLRKDEIEIGILNKFLDVLRKVEDGEVDPDDHEDNDKGQSYQSQPVSQPPQAKTSKADDSDGDDDDRSLPRDSKNK